MGKVDRLAGFKENVITGHLIPAGTGAAKLQSIRLKYLGTEIEEELPVQEEAPRSYDDVAAEWRDADGAEDEFPEETTEVVFDEEELDGFGETDAGIDEN
jgi:DNA-directed RNA polymerase subunit beta'